MLQGLLRNAADLFAGRASPSSPLASVRSDFQTGTALVRAWADGSYPGVSTRAVMILVAALVYLVTPVDAIPDFIPGVGLVDDFAVLSVVARQLRVELDTFKLTQPGA
jgi:uncharacterized membrane protein YkvA (DUF1232 family)